MRTHKFALYAQNLIPFPIMAERAILISDRTLIHRIKHVLRLLAGDQIILFNGQHHSYARVNLITEKEAAFLVEPSVINQMIEPQLVVQLALLRREALEEAVSTLVTVGVTDIQLVLTERIQRSWGGQHEFDRLQRCMIAAAEQSKHFTNVRLHEPVSLLDLCEHNNSGIRVLCDSCGASIHSVLKKDVLKQTFYGLVGPEGDFTDQEKKITMESGYISCRLTPTVLRSEYAAFLIAGIVRSM
jgi:RsmE family RNA methyltransferase